MRGTRNATIWAAALVGTLAPLPAPAQFQGLTTNGNSSALYFSSRVRQIGTNESFHSKIFRWDAAGGIQVFAEVPSEGQLRLTPAGEIDARDAARSVSRK